MGRKERIRWLLIWHSIVWTIWKSLNDIFFLEGTFFVQCLVDKVKLLSCKWFLGKHFESPFFFCEWVIHATLCKNQWSLLGYRFVSQWVRNIGGSFVDLSYMWLILIPLSSRGVLLLMVTLRDSSLFVVFLLVFFAILFVFSCLTLEIEF
jgi:hypothetical protein